MSFELFNVIGLSVSPSDYNKNFLIIEEAIEYCRQNAINGLKLPSGTFHIYNKKALDLRNQLLSAEIAATDYDYWHSQNNVAFSISDFENFTIVGNNTKIFLDGLIGAFDIRNVENFKIEDITLDWVNPLYFTGRVIDVIKDKIIVEPDIELKGNEPIVSFQNVDLTTGRQKGMSVFYGISNVVKENHKQVSFTSIDTVGLSIDDGIICRYIYGFAPIIRLYLCENAEFNRLTIHSGCGMGVVAHKCGNLNFEEYRDIPSNGRAMSTNTDATHFISCYGNIHFNNCEFEAMGDDAVNVHGFYMNVKDIVDGKTLIVNIDAGVQSGINDIPDVGDKVEFCDGETLSPFETGEIAAVEADEFNSQMKVSFKEKISDKVKVGTTIANTSKTAKLLVENCTVKNIRGRAMLIQTRGAVIKNNYFEGCTGQGVHIDTATGWWESIGTRDIEVSNNKFIDCGYGITKYCDAVGVVIETEADKNAVGVHKNIVIKDNYIKGHNVGIKLLCAENVTLSGNVFVDCKREYDIYFCENVMVNGKLHKVI